MKNLILLLLLTTFFISSCGSDDDVVTGPTTFEVTIENVVTPYQYYQSGVVNMPVGEIAPGPIFPGGSYEITFNAGPNILPMDAGPKLSFATMFVQSNDLFLAPSEEGISLFDDQKNPIGDGTPVDVTDQVQLWDAGTEVNEVTGGPNQKPQQDITAGQANATDVGEDENGVVVLIENNTDGTNVLPDVSEVIRVWVSYLGENQFKVTFENVSNAMTMAIPFADPNARGPVPMSPFVWAVTNGNSPFFVVGEAASEGIEDIAEDGESSVETTRVTENTGLIVPLSPGVWAVHNDSAMPLFSLGASDRGEGLAAIAEDGDPSGLAAALKSVAGVGSSDVFNIPEGSIDPSAIGPGGKYTFAFDASPGDQLSMATMFVQSNDWFYSFSENGVPLFNGNDAISGDLTSSIMLYDSGSEVDQYPGAGADQVIRQSAANTGAVDSDTNVRFVTSAPVIVPTEASSVIKVTIAAQ